MIRTFDMDIFNHLCKRMPEIAENYAKAWRCTVDTLSYKTPAAINNAELVQELIPSFQNVFGEENVRKRNRDKGGEDFGYVANEVPGAYFVIGTEDPEHHSLHHPGVLIDEDGYVYGTAVLAECAWNWLKEHKA